MSPALPARAGREVCARPKQSEPPVFCRSEVPEAWEMDFVPAAAGTGCAG